MTEAEKPVYDGDCAVIKCQTREKAKEIFSALMARNVCDFIIVLPDQIIEGPKTGWETEGIDQ